MKRMLVVLIFAATTAAAQQDPAPEPLKSSAEHKRDRKDVFEELDRDGNELLSRSEWPGKERSFRKMDASKDGVLSREEFLATNGRYWNELFQDLDFNDDGVVTRLEWLDDETAFDLHDKDRNGVIDRHEFHQLWCRSCR